MSERMYRAQILLNPEQRRKLEEIAKREGRSISAVTRQVIDAGLALFDDQTEVWNKRMMILAEMRKMREEQPFVYSGNLIEESWQDQDDEDERVWRGDM